jgi:hypothetical protein
MDSMDATDTLGDESESPCPPGLTECGGECVDTDADHGNCGECGNACADDEVCSDGACTTECPEGTVVCDGACVDTTSNVLHCGGCGVECEPALHADPVCEMGVCGTVCHTGWADLDGDGSCESDCVPASDTEACNGVDDNCNGEIDESFDCRMGRETGCTTTCGSTGTGMCGLDCAIPPPESCTPPAESCNGADDDCDTTCDNGFECCRSIPVDCTTTCDTTGSRACSSTCTLGACVPPAEICNGIDDDCDDDCDEGFTCCVGEPGTCTTGCGTTGTTTCDSSCDWDACVPPTETCNGTDDDCDTVPDDTTGCTLPVYRFSCPGDHFYKNNTTVPSGCTIEGGGRPAFYTYASAVSGTSFTTTELFRLWKGSVTDHFYCSRTSERDYAISLGFVLEGNIGYCSPTAVSGVTTPLYRLYSGSASDHFYTTSASERDYAISIGYVLERTECHVWSSP